MISSSILNLFYHHLQNSDLTRIDSANLDLDLGMIIKIRLKISILSLDFVMASKSLFTERPLAL